MNKISAQRVEQFSAPYTRYDNRLKIIGKTGRPISAATQLHSIARRFAEILALCLMLAACGDNIQIAEEPDAALIGSTCEAINTWPSCFRESCPGAQARTCSYTRLCQQWDDELCSCYQCRILYECWCE